MAALSFFSLCVCLLCSPPQPCHTRCRSPTLAPTSRRRPLHRCGDGVVGQPEEAVVLSGGVRGRLAAIEGFSSTGLLLLHPFPSIPHLFLLRGVRLQEAVVAEAVQREVELLSVSEL